MLRQMQQEIKRVKKVFASWSVIHQKMQERSRLGMNFERSNSNEMATRGKLDQYEMV